jgi:hypothetical protein
MQDISTVQWKYLALRSDKSHTLLGSEEVGQVNLKRVLLKAINPLANAAAWKHFILMTAAFVLLLFATAPAEAYSISITNPKSGDIIDSYNICTIKWDYTGSTGDLTNKSIILEYSTDAGATWKEIDVDVPIVPSIYDWIVPNEGTNQARVRITVIQSPGNLLYIETSAETGDFEIISYYWPSGIPAFPPCNLTAATVSDSEIKIDWKDVSVNETGFSIERKEGSGSFAEIAQVASNVNSYTDQGLKTCNDYTYRVKTLGDGNTVYNSYYSREAGAKTICKAVFIDKSKIFINPDMILKTVVSPPNNLAAKTVSDTQIDLSWTDNSDNETGFSIERNDQGGNYATVGSAGVDVTTFSDKGLSSGTSYTYRVKALGNGGNIPDSSYSNESSSMTSVLITPMPPVTVLQTELRYYIGSSEYYVDNQVQSMDTVPIIRDSRTLLPIRYVAEPLGALVGWNPLEQRVTISLDGKNVDLWINNSMAGVNGIGTPIDPQNPKVTPIIVPPGRTMLPLRFIAEKLGCQVDWNQAQQEVKVTYPKP